MGIQKILFAFLFIATCSYCMAQKRSNRSAGYRVPVVSENKARIVCPIFNVNQYPYQGLGLKFGDPTAITYKLYPDRHWAFAVDVGKTSVGLYNDYYKHLFNSYAQIDTVQKTYISHQATSNFFLETKLLYQWDIEKISKGLQLYAGLGWQWRNTSLNYTYTYKSGSNTKPGKLTGSSFTYGPVAILGFEYANFSLPISAFIEVELFTDNMADPGYHRFQGGVGLRYVF
ncbi:MAG TPA: hypothetical protein DGG95_14065 [Cytophagales bacterium]|jgi:hypothetical protein|nr:hypothetical protein [Cytophagales bacterium]